MIVAFTVPFHPINPLSPSCTRCPKATLIASVKNAGRPMPVPQPASHRSSTARASRQGLFSAAETPQQAVSAQRQYVARDASRPSIAALGRSATDAHSGLARRETTCAGVATTRRVGTPPHPARSRHYDEVLAHFARIRRSPCR